MRPSETLRHEHQVILLVLEAAEREARAIEETGRADTERVAKMLDFFRNFADRCHHAKEERHLFPGLERMGAGEPVGAMLQEHEAARHHLAAVAQALPGAGRGEPAAVGALRKGLLAYAGLLRAHIDKEDNALFPAADRLLSPEEQRRLGEAFERVEAEEIGEGVHARYHRLAHELAG